MKIEQRKWTAELGWDVSAPRQAGHACELVLVFGATAMLQRTDVIRPLHERYPGALLFGCSTAGEICGEEVLDDSVVATAVRFEHSHLRSAHVALADIPSSFDAGCCLGAKLPRTVADPLSGIDQPLVHVIVLTDGLRVNGSELVTGMTQRLPSGVALTGGMAGDGARFGHTLVFLDGMPVEGMVAALGLYGARLKIGYGSLGGWDPFGPERLITRSEHNILYEVDGKSALGLYKQYLGEHAADLPASGLLFPLSIRTEEGRPPVVRTILAIDERSQSLTFAGEVPQGAYARLMKANFNRLVDGATAAARTSHQALGAAVPELALLISCVGRKLVLKQRAEDEVEAVRQVLGGRATLAGFYSYGEIAPFAPGANCELHNQTMTITTVSEY